MTKQTSDLYMFNHLVHQWQSGNDEARDKMVQIVYREVENIASSILRRNAQYRSLVTCELANEAFIKLFLADDIKVNDRAHLLALCARIMRFIVIDKTRQRMATKNQGYTVTLHTGDTSTMDEDVSVLALEAALLRLQEIDQQRADIVEMRYFGGMTYEEIAEVTGQSVSTVKRSWVATRAWLKDWLENEH